MTPEQWTRLETLFEGALPLSAPQREQFIEASCPDDPLLRSELLSLLRLAPATAEFLETPVICQDLDRLTGLADELRDPLLGRRVDSFQLIERISVDDDGVTYRGRDAESCIYALRVLAPRPGQPPSQAAPPEWAAFNGFAAAPVARGKFALDGAPKIEYLAWAWLDATPITEHANRSGFGIRERVELLLGATRYVSELHAAGAAHGRLTSRRIAVARDGSIVLLDLGLSSSLGLSSPEPPQAADIRGIGACFFELLTGRALSSGQIAPRLREVDARFDQELENLVAACLAQAPATRPSAPELAARLTRYLAGEGAQRPAWPRTLPSRRAAISGALALLFVALAAYGVWMSLSGR